MTLLRFQFDKSGKDFNEEQLLNKLLILVIFFVSQFDISGKYSKESKSENKLLMSLILSIFQLDISGKETIDLQP